MAVEKTQTTRSAPTFICRARVMWHAAATWSRHGWSRRYVVHEDGRVYLRLVPPTPYLLIQTVCLGGSTHFATTSCPCAIFTFARSGNIGVGLHRDRRNSAVLLTQRGTDGPSNTRQAIEGEQSYSIYVCIDTVSYTASAIYIPTQADSPFVRKIYTVTHFGDHIVRTVCIAKTCGWPY